MRTLTEDQVRLTAEAPRDALIVLVEAELTVPGATAAERHELATTITDHVLATTEGVLFASALTAHLRAGIEGGRLHAVHSYFWGAMDAYWVALYKFAQDVLGLVYEDAHRRQLAAWDRIVRSVGWWWPFEGVVVLSDRPSVLELELFQREQRFFRLHHATGPAVAYRDNWAVYAWHGVQVPEQLILDPESITALRIIEERNAELQRIMLEICGAERLLGHCTPLGTDDWGTLWQLRLPNPSTHTLGRHGEDPAILTFVEVKNSTPEPDGHYKTYVIPVHPQARPLLANGEFGPPQEVTPLNAIASTFGLRGEEYQRLRVQT